MVRDVVGTLFKVIKSLVSQFVH
ncbi:alpha family phenol-soluble modulin [Pedobacter jejuensis]